MPAPDPPSLPPRTIGLIGGEGVMGRLFGRLFQADGHRVLTAGPSGDPGYGGLVEQSDVIIVTVPIAETVRVIERIGPLLRPGQLLSDFTSIKSEPVTAMVSTAAHVIGCHPLFGPMPDPAGQNVVLCPARPGPYLDWYRGFFAAHGMTVTVMEPAAHDEAMAFIQGLTHFINITFARTLQTQQANLAEILQVCSPVYQVFFSILCRILAGDPQLYGQIQVSNPENLPVLEDFLRNSEELLAAVREPHPGEVIRLFNSAADFLGDYKAVARENSDILISRMTEYLAGRRDPNEG